MKNCIASQYIL